MAKQQAAVPENSVSGIQLALSPPIMPSCWMSWGTLRSFSTIEMRL